MSISIVSIFGLLMTVFWVWMLIHALTNRGISGGEKVAWVLVILVLPMLGAIIYFFFGKPRGRAAVG